MSGTSVVRDGLEYFYDDNGTMTGFRPAEWGQPTPEAKPVVSRGLYRWECPDCGKHGRWYKNGNTADAMGETHRDKYTRGHDPVIVDDTGRKHHSV